LITILKNDLQVRLKIYQNISALNGLNEEKFSLNAELDFYPNNKRNKTMLTIKTENNSEQAKKIIKSKSAIASFTNTANINNIIYTNNYMI
jgi:hypothetical protein